MSLTDAIAEALANATPPPKNESTTCDWVIYPLLLACGYARREIESRIADNNGQFPDYAILPDNPQGWFLEAKSWTIALEDRHAQQALNYANQNGKRWVVLTNGQEWRLYDNLVQGVAADKLAAAARLDSGEPFEAFLGALSKASVCAGEVERFAARARLEQFLAAQLADENSETVRAVHGVVKRQPGLAGVSRAEVAGLLRRTAAEVGPAKHASTDASSAAPIAAPHTNGTADAAGIIVPLDEARAHPEKYLTHRSPAELHLPDGSLAAVRWWSDVLCQAVTWMAQRGTLPALPFRGRCGGKRWFINTEPMHTDQPMRSHAKVEANGIVAYINTHMSAQEALARLSDVCEAAGVPISGFVVTLRAGQHSIGGAPPV